MKRLCIIPCGRKKIWDNDQKAGATEAKDVYIGTFGKACQSYASLFFDDWLILSAKHGYLKPSDMIPENYDVAFDSRSSEIISINELKDFALKNKLDVYDQIVVLGGKKHQKVVEQIFPREKLLYPLKGLSGIGYMVQSLQQAVKRGKEL